MLDVPHELVGHGSWLIYARRRELRSRWRRLSCFEQALLTLARPRKNETLARLGAGFGVSQATAWRYADGTVELLAAWAAGLSEALMGVGGGDFMIVDGDPEIDHCLRLLRANVVHPRVGGLIFHPPAELRDASAEGIVDEAPAYRPIAVSP